MELRSQEGLNDASSLTGSHPTLLDKQTITLSHPEGKEGWKGVVLEPGKATIIGRREVCTLLLVCRVDRLTVRCPGCQWNYVSDRRYCRTRCLARACTTRNLPCYPTPTTNRGPPSNVNPDTNSDDFSYRCCLSKATRVVNLAVRTRAQYTGRPRAKVTGHLGNPKRTKHVRKFEPQERSAIREINYFLLVSHPKSAWLKGLAITLERYCELPLLSALP